jgi:TP901 family phage tail tape measure protein
VSLNFDAQINLNVGPFLASIERAKGAVKALNGELNAIANRKINVQVNVAGANNAAAASGASQAQSLFKQAQANSQVLSNEVRQRSAIEGARDANIRGMARERYALYDVAAAYQQVSQIALGAVKAMSGAAISYERSFANVIRTTDFTSIKDQFDVTNQMKNLNEAARVMKYSLTQVAAEIPIAFGKITEIATIGNQLGIAQGKLKDFSKTVAQFSTITGMTAEATAMSFGRIGELLNEGDYTKLGASIAYAGVKAVATEEQIASVTKEIATTAKMAKFTTPEVVGLATALSSVGIAPEAARGSIMRTFAGINKAVAEGGANLENYASISGMSAQEFSASWTKNGQVAFDSFVKGLQGMSDSGQNLDTVLRGIGLKNVRDIQTIQKLGDNYNVYAESIRNATSAYNEGTFLSEAYATIQDTVAAKLELVQNNFQNLLASLGASTSEGVIFKWILDQVNALLKTLNDAARNPIVRDWLMPIFTIIIGLVGAFAALNAAVALSLAAIRAYGTAMGVATVETTMMANGVEKTTVSLNKAAVAAKFFGTALKGVAWIAGISLLIEGFAQLAAAMAPVEQKAESLLGGFAGLQDAFTQDTKDLNDAAKAAGQTAEQYAAANGIILVHTDALDGNDQAAKDAKIAHDNLLLIVGSEPDAYAASTGAIGSQTIAIGQNTQAWIRNQMAQSKDFQDVAKNKDLGKILASSGYDPKKAMEATAAGNADAYFKRFEKDITSYFNQKKKGFDLFANLNADIARGDLSKLKDTVVGTYNEILLLGLGGETATDKITTGTKKATDTMNKLKSAASKTVRTVIDYAADLVGIFKRIDDIQFSKQTGLDQIADGWKNIGDKAKDAEKAIKDAEATISGIKADKSVLEYQLTVATRYGDVKRIASINAQLAKKNIELANAEKAKADATDAANKSLDVNTKGTSANRAAMLDMLGKYQSYIQALAATGMKGTELETSVANLKKDFTDQATALGYNSEELKTYTGQFDQYVKTIHDTPRDVTVEFQAKKSAEFNAVQEYLAKEHKLFVKVVRSDDGTLNTVGSGASSSSGSTSGAGSSGSTALAKPSLAADQSRIAYIENTILPAKKTALANAANIRLLSERIYEQNRLKADITTLSLEITNLKSRIRANSYATGGFIQGPGTGTSDSVPAMLSNGEYVVNAAAVRSYGVDFMNSLNQMKVGRMPANMGSNAGSSSGSGIVYLSPDDRALLRAAIDRPVNLFADSTKIASTANTGNILLAQRGLN